MKNNRQSMILDIIAKEHIETQEQLLEQLRQRGVASTQATISRDIKQLRIIKELGSTGAYRYSVSAKPVEHTFSAKLNIIFKQCLTSVEHAQNILVIKTMPGLASAACSALDKMNIPEIVGTLAGVYRHARLGLGVHAVRRASGTDHTLSRRRRMLC